MPTYSYRCACGPFELVRPMAAAAEPAPCPACARPGVRVFAAPALRRLTPGIRGAVEAGERSAETPDVVRRLPSGERRTRVPTDPRHARLPRP